MLVKANGAEISTEAFGRRGDPPVLLIMGAMASMIWWDASWISRLVAGGRFVLRYDHRDTGRSTSHPPGELGYTLSDMADDARAVLDAYGVTRAHLVGMSLGGVLGQMLAIEHPARVASLTLVSSTPADAGGRDLPPMKPEVGTFFEGLFATHQGDRQTAIETSVRGWQVMAGTKRPFDAARYERLSALDFDRASSYPSRLNHAQLGTKTPWHGRLDQIQAPTLVVHGTEDPILPGHGQILAEMIPQAELMLLEGAGHVLDPADADAVVGAILKLTAR